MEQINDLKAVLYSKRANIFYLEKCRVMAKDGRVVYLTQERNIYAYYNIPIANTTFILLGTGTSITQSAMRMMCSAGVMVGFSGTDGTPFFAGTEIEWVSPQSEYRPTDYVQQWLSFWFDDQKRLNAGKEFQYARIEYIIKIWSKDRQFNECGLYDDDIEVQRALKQYKNGIDKAEDVNQLLLYEARFTKHLYKIVCSKAHVEFFERDRDSKDNINVLLNHGNYLAYGLAAVTLWALGIPHGFPVMHGKTRRGALVFDVADLVKDAIVLPLAITSGSVGASSNEFRAECIKYFTDYKTLDYMFDKVKVVASQLSVGDVNQCL
ncbi:MAG: type I-F CRISPR-associated endonuclease Cas1f [Sphaerochaetaceae bacterium]